MTTAKEVAVSANGSDFYTLPGMSGDFNDEADQIDDTVFGQTFQSQQPGLITWTSSAQAFYKGFAGYVASLKSSGTSTSMTAEACSLVSGKTYKITDATKNVFDYTKTLTVLDSASPVAAADIESINYLFGQVTFKSTYTPSGAITVTGWYLPMTEVSRANSFTLTQTTQTVDNTDFATARANSGYRVFEPGLRTVTLELGGFYDYTDAVWEVLEGRSAIVIEINPDGSGLSLARGIFKLVTRGQSGDVGALEEQTRSFSLSVPENITTVFDWSHDTDTTMSAAIRVLLDAFINQTLPHVRYMPDGASGLLFAGQAVLTDVSLSSSLDAMNEFKADFQGSDQPTRADITT